jgi:hypothetical protein
VKRQAITRLATPSIAESIPNPISAIEPAMMPALTATAPSTPIHARLSQESTFARPAARSHSGARFAPRRGGLSRWRFR